MGQADTQAEELEALEAIYPGEIEVENREYPNIVFRISLHLHSELVGCTDLVLTSFFRRSFLQTLLNLHGTRSL